MTEEPYRWLEAVENRREYVLEQLKEGSPVFAVSLDEGILLLGVGSGQSKVFEVFDRLALAALGHPADVEKIRQGTIDAAHVEAFTRAAEDVSLRRLVGFVLSPLLKNNFEQLFTAPYLVNTLLAELGSSVQQDSLTQLRFDGSFESVKGVAVAAATPALEQAMARWLAPQIGAGLPVARAADLCLQAWWLARKGHGFEAVVPEESARQAGWRAETTDRVIEAALLMRHSARAARYAPVLI